MTGSGHIGVRLRRLSRAAMLPLLAALLCLTGVAPPFGASVAFAQERRGLLDMLFGGPPPREYERAPPRRVIRAKPRTQRNKPSARAPKSNAAARPTKARRGVAPPAVADLPVIKRDTAKTVLVVGDFMAGSLAGGLESVLAENPDLKVVSAADGSSGLVRDDHYDWGAEIGSLIDKHKPSLVVVMLGANDRQAINVAGASLDPRTPGWTATYETRATTLAGNIEARKVPLLWVGMPSFKLERMSADMAYLNEIYRKAAVSAGGEFVDVWDGFVDASGAFTFSGPDISGQPARLRNSDGITMTPEGAEKLAFFAQKPIFRLLGTTADGTLPLDLDEPAIAKLPAVNAANAVSAPLVALSDPALDGGEALLGGKAAEPNAAQPSPRDRLVISGVPAVGAPGRADDFNRSGKTATVAPLTPADAVVFRGTVDVNQLRTPGPISPPPPMPSLSDAILDDWSRQKATGTTESPLAAPPTAKAGGRPAATAPFVVDETPR
jgi:hypothetical protein